MHFYCKKNYFWPETGIGLGRGLNRPLWGYAKCSGVDNLARKLDLMPQHPVESPLDYTEHFTVSWQYMIWHVLMDCIRV